MSSDDEQPTAAPAAAAPPARPHQPPPPPTRRHSVRFSTELPRAIPEALDIGSTSRLEFPPSFHDAPVSPRNRNRGYSLRRQLFFRNGSSVTDDDGRSTARTSSSDTVELGRLTTSPSPPEMRKAGADDTDDEELMHYRPRPMRAAGLRRWWKELGVMERYEYTRKTIFREHEIPPSKDGRKIPLRAHYDVPLIDERTGGNYVNNTIRSGRYTVWNFLPKQLFYQFSKLANFYFLCVSVLQMIPTLSTTGTYTTIVPLIFFITLSISKEGYDDYRRYKEDIIENRRETAVIRVVQRSDGTPTTEWKKVKWSEIQVGDIIKLERDDWFPADLVILHSEAENGIAYIETMALDGETNLKSKQALPCIAECCDTPEKLATCEADMVVEDPNLDLYNFEGKVTVGNVTKPLSNSQIIYRGSVLRNTPSMIGVVIFTGEESKIRMNANKNPRTKAPALQAIINKIVIMTVFLVLFLAVFCSVGYYQFWRKSTERKSFYLDGGTVAFFPIIASYIIMFNTLIPLSLYVSLEIVKVAQMWLLNDIDMYHEETNTPFEAHTSTINEDCGQISYIFSDKTGTLTDNAMLFRKLSVGGQAWLHDVDIERPDANKILHKKRKPKNKGKGKGKSKKTQKRESKACERAEFYDSRKSMGDLASPRYDKYNGRPSLDRKESSNSLTKWQSTADPARPQPQLSTMDLLGYLQTHPHTFFARKARFFLLAIALCHTCLPEMDEDGDIDYSAASPDELALVRAAQELDYIAIDRDINTVTIKSFPNGPDGEPLVEVYQILEVIEFSSKRKRMSIIIRFPSGKICIFCKGADTTLIDLLRLRELAAEKSREVEKRATIRKSLEAQEHIRRNSMARPSIGTRPSFSGRPSIGTRPSFSGRPSIGGRPSMSGPGRASMALNRLKPIRDLDQWMRERQDKAGRPSVDEESLYSRPSGQYAARHSIAFGEAPMDPMDHDMDEDIVDENLALDDARVFERCFAHVNDFATEGLRTLLYAHRFLEEHEYNTWQKIYSDATTSISDRQALIERAAELIEREFELTGATAIEDKLQAGVPEAIDKLRRAGIRMWMLTGDKRETAINIGHSCRLIKDYSTVTILDNHDVGLGKKIRGAIQDINNGSVAHSVVVVDGSTLSTIDANPTLKSLFFDLAVSTDSVVCCRASPSQKASLVKTIRTKVENAVTLAIGDGANDIAMIQEAHVGVGITGKEGLQAARVADYSMAQFRFLLKFLLVHGRWNYIRTCKYVAATFWKEMLFYLTQALFQYWNGYTGSSLYEPWSLSMFNTLFTSLPVIFLGIFEKDLAASTLLAIPELYQKGPQNRGFNFQIYFAWMALAVCQAMLTYFLMFALYAPNLTVDQGVYGFGVLTFSICITVINAKCQLIETHNKSLMAALSLFLSFGGWWLWNIILAGLFQPDATNNVIHNVHHSFFLHFGTEANWWLTYLLGVAACLLLDVAIITTRVAFWPDEDDVFREIEKSRDMRKRLEEEASDELQQGWKRGSWRGDGEVMAEGERERRDLEMEQMVEARFGKVRTERERSEPERAE